MNIFRLCGDLCRYLILHLRSLDYYTKKYSRLPLPDTPQKVIISFTTIPDRIHKIGPMVKSLLDQEVRPHHIYLVLPDYSIREGKPYLIPSTLEKNPHLTIVRVEKDWGPITKFIPTLLKEKTDPDTRIIVVDDDTIYSKKLVSTFVAFSDKYPDAALAFRGWTVPESFNHSERVNIISTRIKEESPVEILQGASGFLVKPAFFDDQIVNYEQAPREAFYVDDIWISGHLARRKIPRFVVPLKGYFVRMNAFNTRDTLSLVKGENSDGSNNATMYRYFRKNWTYGQCSGLKKEG